jgi:hypothetical protein
VISAVLEDSVGELVAGTPALATNDEIEARNQGVCKNVSG